MASSSLHASPSSLVQPEANKDWRGRQALRLAGFGDSLARLATDKKVASAFAELSIPPGAALCGHYQVQQRSAFQLQLPKEFRKHCTASLFVGLYPGNEEHRPLMRLFRESTYAWLMNAKSLLEHNTEKMCSFAAESFIHSTLEACLLQIPKGPLRDALCQARETSNVLTFAGAGDVIEVWHPEEYQAFVEKMQAYRREKALQKQTHSSHLAHHHRPPT